MANISKLNVTLYDANETQFDHNGLGVLSELLLYEVEEVNNGEFELTIDYPVTGRLYEKIKEKMLIKAKPNRKDDPTVFRIYEYDVDSISGIMRIFARHKNIDDFGGNMVENITLREVTPTIVINAIKNNALEPFELDFWTDVTATSSVEWERRSVLNCIAGQRGSIIDNWSGEIKHGTNRLWLYRRRGRDNVTTVRHGKNLRGLNMTYSTKGLVTAILPFFTMWDEDAEDYTTITGPVVYSEHKDKYPQLYFEPVEFSSEDGVTDLASLNRVAGSWFTDNTERDLPSVRMDIDLEDLSQTEEYSEFKDFEQVEIGDTLTVYSKRMNLNLNGKVNRVVYDGLTDMNSRVTVGSVSRSLGDDFRNIVDEALGPVASRVNEVMWAANGKNKVFRGPDEPVAFLEGDIWFKPLGEGHVEMYIWDGIIWEPILNTSDIDRVSREIEEAQEGIDDAKESADKANQEINDAINAAGFSTLSDLTADIQSISTRADANALAARDSALSASTTAESAMTLATDLSGQVSDFELTVNGFNQTVNNYTDQVAQFTSDVNGLNSTVASYESQVDEFGNTVSTYATQVSQFENTVSGLNSTVSNYRSDVKGYQSQVSTLTNTVNGFNATVQRVEGDYSDLNGTVQSLGSSIGVVEGQITNKVWQTDIQTAVDGIEVGGRNLLSTSPNNWEHGWIDHLTGRDNGSGSHIRMKPDVRIQVEGNRDYTISGKERIVVFQYNSEDDFILRDDIGVNNLPKVIKTSQNTAYLRVFLFTVSSSWTLEDVILHEFKIEKGNKATGWTPAPEDTTQLISNVETEWKQTAQGFEQSITRVETGLNGKASLTAFNTLTSTVNGTVTRVGNAEGKITTIETNVNGLQTTVAGKASQTQVTQLANGLSSVVTDLSNLEIGGRNLLKNSGTRHSNTGYPVAIYTLTEPIPNNSEVTISIKATLGRDRFGIYNSGGSVSPTSIYPADKKNGVFRKTFKWSVGTSSNTAVNVYPMPNGTGTATTIEWIKLEYGNRATDWTPAPEDMATQSQITQLSNNINLRVEKGDVMSQINIEAGRTLIQSNRLYLDAQSVVFSGKAFIPDAAITTLTADKLTAGTIDANNINVINLNVSSLVGNISNFVTSNWNASAGGNVSITSSGLISTATNGAQSLVQNGVFLTRNTVGATLGYIGYDQTGSSPFYTITTSVGSLFRIRASTGGTTFKSMFELYPGSDETYIRTANIYGNGTMTLAGGLLVGANIHLNSNNLINAYGLYLDSGGTFHGMSSNGEVRITSPSHIRIRTSDSNTAMLMEGTTHIYIYRTLNMQGNNITQQSDERLKENIVLDEIDSLKAIRRWQMAGFDWIDEDYPDERQFSLIAQTAPEIASEGSDGYLTVNSSKQLSMVTHAVQQLDKEHENTLLVASHAYILAEQHEDELEGLRKEVKELKDEIEELRGEVA